VNSALLFLIKVWKNRFSCRSSSYLAIETKTLLLPGTTAARGEERKKPHNYFTTNKTLKGGGAKP